MKKRIASILTAGVLTASVFSVTPIDVSAAEEYLIRDKWGYCQTANYAESEHFVIFYGNHDTTGQVNDAFLQRNLADYEKLWKCYGEFLGMTDMNVDIYGKSKQKYKTNVYLTYTGLPQFPDGWAFMSAEDGYGIEIISPEAMLDDLTIAHEFGHVVTMQQKAWVDQDITGAWWESLANWFREMYLSSEYYTGTTETEWFEPYIRNMSLSLPHGRDYYEVWPFLMYLETNPDGIDGLGQFTVKRMISEARPGEYPFDTITRLCGTDVQTVFGHYAKRMATFDLGAKTAYQKRFREQVSNLPYYMNLFYTMLEDTGTGWMQSPQWEAPMQAGINIVPLEITGSEITAELRGLSDDANAAWQACIVTVDNSDTAHYSALFGSGDAMTVSASGIKEAYLSIAAMPTTLYHVNAFHKEADSPYRTGDERRRYPYEVRLNGAEIKQVSGYSAQNCHRHTNGGGLVSAQAKVADSVYVGPDAMVLGNAVVSGNARIEGHAVIGGGAVIKDNAVISGNAVVHGGNWVYTDSWKTGNVEVSENAVISGNAVVSGMCKISGDALITQKAYVCDAVTVTDHAVIKGTSYLYGTGIYSGGAVTDGDYANTETKNSGVGFGWLDEKGWLKSADGHLAAYDFADECTNWARDTYTASNARLVGAEWAAERTSAKGVVNFDGADSHLLLDSSLLQTNDLTLHLAALWKGGADGQELLHFGDANAYISFTPCGADGKARLTLTDGVTTETLSAPALSKGEWSKITVRIINGTASLQINGTEAESKAVSLTPRAIMSASASDLAVLGKGFNGALDYISFHYQNTAAPDLSYSGKEAAEETALTGDVNADGIRSVADAVMLCKYLAADGDVIDWKAGDLNQDKALTGTDLTMLKQLLINAGRR